MTRLAFTLLAAAYLPWAVTIHAREATKPYSQKNGARPLAAIPPLTVEATDVAAELASDAQKGVSTPLRIAAVTALEVTPATHGAWEVVPGGRLWRLRVNASGATDLSLGFSRFRLHGASTLHLLCETEDYVQGGFTARDNKPHGQLWTPVLPGERMVVELFVPDDTQAPELILTQVNRGYRDMFRRKNDLGIPKAGACNNDVICAVGDPWRNEIRSVATYTLNGSFACTGTLINDVVGDRKNFFLTANHCGISVANAATMVVYWNFQAPVCGQQNGGSLAQNQSGATFRMSRFDVDATLVELEDVPDNNFNVYYAGWDRATTASPGAVGIHHPNTDEKSISFTSPSSLISVNSCIGTGGSGTHWSVVWNDGVTEPGSSGSGIWNPVTHRLIGFLSGGISSCSIPNGADCYGKFSSAWALGTTPATRLRDWLDPLNLNSNFVAGLDSVIPPAPAAASVVGIALTAESCAPANGSLDPGESVTFSITVTNSGGMPLTNLVGTLLPGTGVSSPSAAQNYGAMPVGTTLVRSFTFIVTGACGGTVSMRVQLQEGALNLGIFTNTFVIGTPNTSFAQNFDGVVTPALPAGWTTSATNSGSAWVSTSVFRDTLPSAIFTTAPGSEADAVVTSPSFGITTTNGQVTFRHRYDFENTYDGGVLEISIGAGPFVDILTSGGVFLAGSYTTTLSTGFGNSLGGRMAWSGLTANFITSTVRLPASAAGQSVRLRWRAGTDSSNAGTGWYVDSLVVGDGIACCSGLVAPSIVNLRRVQGNVAFSFPSVAGQSYQIEFKGFLGTPNWQVLQTIAGDGTLKHFTNGLTTTNRFFRVRSP